MHRHYVDFQFQESYDPSRWGIWSLDPNQYMVQWARSTQPLNPTPLTASQLVQPFFQLRLTNVSEDTIHVRFWVSTYTCVQHRDQTCNLHHSPVICLFLLGQKRVSLLHVVVSCSSMTLLHSNTNRLNQLWQQQIHKTVYLNADFTMFRQIFPHSKRDMLCNAARTCKIRYNECSKKLQKFAKSFANCKILQNLPCCNNMFCAILVVSVQYFVHSRVPQSQDPPQCTQCIDIWHISTDVASLWSICLQCLCVCVGALRRLRPDKTNKPLSRGVSLCQTPPVARRRREKCCYTVVISMKDSTALQYYLSWSFRPRRGDFCYSVVNR